MPKKSENNCGIIFSVRFPSFLLFVSVTLVACTPAEWPNSASIHISIVKTKTENNYAHDKVDVVPHFATPRRTNGDDNGLLQLENRIPHSD